MRVAVFGDVGGHLSPFVRALKELGVDFSDFSIPEDLTIIQVGDLIHRGPDSDEMVLLADLFINSDSGDRWIQLIGNHELQHIPGSQDFWRCKCKTETVDTIQSWWTTGDARTAVALLGNKSKYLPQENTIITHAGLSSVFLDTAVRRRDPVGIVSALNEMQAQNLSLLKTPGALLKEVPTPSAGPFWAIGTSEVYQTWTVPDEKKVHLPNHIVSDKFLELNGIMPFNQIHGHTSMFLWDEQRWRGSTALHFRKNSNAYVDKRMTRYLPNIGSGAFIGIDPGFEKEVPRVSVQPYFLIDDVSSIYAR